MKRRASIHNQSLTFKRLVKVWLIQHAQAFIQSLGQMTKNLMGSILTTAVIGISLSLPAGFYLLLDNAQRITAGWGGAAQITLFLNQDIGDDGAMALAETLKKNKDINYVKLIDRNAALAEYKLTSGFDEALAVLEENPLPAVLLLQPTNTTLSSGNGGSLLKYLHALPEVDTAQFDRQWAKRLFAMIKIFQRVVIILSTLLAVAVLLIIGNTIRLAIYNRRSEIEIHKLFGATNAFIRRPFLYSGLIHGVVGSIMAWILLVSSIKLLEQPVTRLSGLYYSNFKLITLTAEETMILVGIGGLLGLLGSWLAVQRHLNAIEPA